YYDANNDGTKQGTETGIGGVTLTLTGTDDLGTITPQTTTTGADGSYSFGNLRPGTYTVTETQPPDYLAGLDARNNAVIAGSGSTDVVSGISVAQNADSPNNNFGEQLPESPPNGPPGEDNPRSPVTPLALSATDDRGDAPPSGPTGPPRLTA